MEINSVCYGFNSSIQVFHALTEGGIIGEQKVYFYFLKRPERYNQEVLSHSFICLPLPYMKGIVLICSIDLYCVIGIFNITGDMFKR